MTPDQPGQESPAPVAREAAPTLHPRYQGIFENEDPSLPPYYVDLSKHDFTDQRWLTPEHRAGLAAGSLDVPDRTQSEHHAVLVSSPHDVVGTDVAWVDRGVAGIVRDGTRLGAPTLESCENAGGREGHYGWTPDMAMLWFKGRRELHRFAEITDGVADEGWEWYQPKWIQIRGWRMYAVGIPVADLPKVTAHLAAYDERGGQ